VLTLTRIAAWEDALDELRDAELELPEPAPPLPAAHLVSLNPDAPAPATQLTADETPTEGGKRKAAPAKAPKGKKAKLAAEAAAAEQAAEDAAMEVNPAAGSEPGAFLSVLRAEDLRAPTLLTVAEMEKYIVGEQKKALLAEYGA